VLTGISTLKNEDENLKKNQAFDEVKGAQVQFHNYQKIWNSSCPKKIPWRKEMEGLSEMITSNENGS
jgi:hypothetical protein